MTDRMIENRIKKILDLEAQIAELQKEVESVKDELKADMEERGADSVVTEKGAKIYWREVISNRFDTTAFKKSHADLYKAYTKETTSRPLKIYAA